MTSLARMTVRRMHAVTSQPTVRAAPFVAKMSVFNQPTRLHSASREMLRQRQLFVRMMTTDDGANKDDKDKPNDKENASGDANKENTTKDDSAEKQQPASEETATAEQESVVNSSVHSSSLSSSSLVPANIPLFYPEVLALPIARKPLFPGSIRSLQVQDSKVAASIMRLKKRGQPYIGLFLVKDDKNESDTIKDMNEIYNVGTFASIGQISQENNGGISFVAIPYRRIRATEIVKSEPFTAVKVENLHLQPYDRNNTTIKALTQEIVATIRDVARLSQLFRENLAISQSSLTSSNFFDDPAQLADFAATVTTAESKEQQEVLEAMVVEDRLRATLMLLKKELVNARAQFDIGKDVEEKISKRQREYFLLEQLKSIKKELGIEKDDKDTVVTKYKEKASGRKMPEHVQKVFDEELKKLSMLEAASPEFNITRNYLDWITAVPWGIQSEEKLDIQHAIKVLDEDHYGLKDVKERILEFIAVGKLRGTVEGKILCLVGPPGVGKTSIGKSIARTLDREFFRFSVGGLTDVAEIKGHRRTYIGAMPGKMVQCLKKTQKENPVVLIDEIDKIGRGWNGDPASALLEMLDPEQNSNFLDHYLDVPVDLSKVLFVCTANVTDTIPGPLLDRMELIRLSGYIAEEKQVIAQKYLVPLALQGAGLTADDVELTRDGIDKLIRSYCREAGVRNLQKHVEKVYRKAALKKLKGELSTPFKIDGNNLKDFVGNPVFVTDRIYEETPVGVVMGLAWTAMGGSTLYIETAVKDTGNGAEDGKAGLSSTGQLGDVMKESTTIAYNYARAFALKKFPHSKFFRTTSLHVHVPEGAVPKDGPSAGVTLTTALLSLALNVPVRSNLAMTGEVTLTGRVLRIGGVKEKTIAAKRSGVTTIIFPAGNKPDWEELDADIKEGLNVHFAETYEDVFNVAFDPAALHQQQPPPAQQ